MTANIDLKKIEAFGELVNKVFAVSNAPVSADAVFVHGWGDLHDEMIEFTAKIFKESGAIYILLNGASEYEVNLPGFTYWKERLEGQYRIPAKNIMAIKPAQNTQIEALALAEFAEKQNISRLIVLSVPQHIVRAFLTDLGVIQEAGLTAKLYPKTLSRVSWLEPITIHNLSGSNEYTTRLGRMAAELMRIIEYRRRFESGDKGFTIASVEEGLKHLIKPKT